MHLKDYLTLAVPLAIRAGSAIEAVTREDLTETEKDDGSPLTRADMASHHVIIKGLKGISPDKPILSEESVDSFVQQYPSPDSIISFWLVDPLDGTKEFIAGRDEYTVNIALVEKEKPLLGVIYAPALDTLWFGAAEVGAYRIEHAAAAFSEHAQMDPTACIAAKQMLLEERTDNKRLVAVASRSHPSPKTQEFLKKHNIETVIYAGSSLKICAVADGKADVYPRFGPTCIWDTAAGAAIANAAGCVVLNPATRTPLKYVPQKEMLKVPEFIVCKPSFIGRLTNEA